MEETRRDNMIYALPMAHRQQATEQHDGVDVAEQRASSQFLLDRVEDGSLADVRLEARDCSCRARARARGARAGNLGRGAYRLALTLGRRHGRSESRVSAKSLQTGTETAGQLSLERF